MSPTAWNLDELRASIRATQPDADSTVEIINSIDRSTRIFRYHMATARDAVKQFVNESEHDSNDNFKLVFGVSERSDDFEHAKIVSEAHMIGSLHTARNLWDLFAQLVNAIVLRQHSIPIGRCDIKRVFAAIPDSPLKARIAELLSSHWFTYVEAFTNTTKHRRLISHGITLSMEDSRTGIKIGAFSYSSKVAPFPSYWLTEVLEGAIEVKNSIIDCGRLLNGACRKSTD